MSARRAVWEVARREIVERSRSRVMRVSIVLLLLASIGGAVAAARLGGGTPTDHFGLVGPRSVGLIPAIRMQAHTAGRRARLHILANRSAAVRAVRDGQIAVGVVDATRLLVKSSGSSAAVRVVQDAIAASGLLNRLRSSGLTHAQAVQILTPRPLSIEVLDPHARSLERNRGLIAIGLVALLMVLVFYGQAVAQGVTEEKSSRVVELLLTTLSPRRLLGGKVAGIGALGLGQLLLAGGTALLAGTLAGGAGLPAAAPKTVALVVLWFVLGYAFYSVAFAAAGALVSRQEDLTTAMLPVNVILLGAFYLALILVNGAPNGAVAQIAAFVPPLAPMVVPSRMVLGNMGMIGLAVAVAIDLVATAGLVVLAAGIYERAILRVGAPVRLHRLFRAAPRRVDATGATPRTDTEDEHARHARMLDVGGRGLAVMSLLAGVVIGLHHPISIGLLAIGLVLVVVLESRKHNRHGRIP